MPHRTPTPTAAPAPTPAPTPAAAENPHSRYTLVPDSGAYVSGGPIYPAVAPTKDFGVQLEEVADKIVTQKITAAVSGAVNKALSYIITAAVAGMAGIVLAVTHDLNGKISEAVGKQSAEQQLYEFKSKELQREIEERNKRLNYYQCIDDPRVKDKAGCYR